MNEINEGDIVLFAGSFFKVAEIKEFPHGKMIGIFDEPKSTHIDYINPTSVSKLYPCNSCQGGGCPVCCGYGLTI